MKSKTFNLTKLFTPLLFIGYVLLAAPVSAQSYQNNNGGKYVTVYQDCGFRGAARNVPVGDYPDMRSIQLNNDSMSSLRVPQGLLLTLYQDDRFGGFSTTFDRDVSCLDKGWNDQASSIKVNWSNSYSDRNNSGDPGYRNGDNNNFYTQQNVDGNNVSRIEFVNNVLEKNGPQQWQLTNSNGQNAMFREQSKNANALYLQSAGNRERLRIDLFTNDVTVIASNGESASYALKRALRANENYRADGGHQGNPRPIDRPVSDWGGHTDTVENFRDTGKVRGKCFDYKAYSDGGAAGLRFHTGDKTFNRFSTKSKSGRICHKGSLVMEITKTSPATDVTVEIQGVKYRFASNEAHDTYLNDWYRKSVTLNVQR